MKVNPSPERSDRSSRFFLVPEMTGQLRRTNSERGSALLIVFVFAAFVAIMLYREMPVFAFEAQRQKEQMLIDRGAQYKRGVKLFYKKFGMYPASIDQLENTNRLRFLRHRFKDPFTGKDDWRLLHMGPGGMLVDSKVNPLKTNTQAGNASGFGTNSGFGSTSNSTANSGFGSNSSPLASSAFGGSSRTTTASSFGSNTNSTSSSGFGSSTSSGSNSGFGSNTNGGSNSGFSSFSSFSSFGGTGSGSGSDQGGVVVQPVPKRAPAIAANGRVSAASTASASPPDQTGLNQPDGSAQAGQSGAIAQAGQSPEPGQVAQPNPGGTDQAGQLQPVQNNGQAGLDQANPAGGAQGANSMNAIRRMLTNPNAQAQASGAGGFRVTSGGLAGIASKAQGHSIKVVSDQVNYSLWEFYYDPSKDVKQVTPGGTGLGGLPTGGKNTFSRAVNNPTPPAPSGVPAPTGVPAPLPAALNQNGLQPSEGIGNPDNPAATEDPAMPTDLPTTNDTSSPDDNSAPNDNSSEPPQ